MKRNYLNYFVAISLSLILVFGAVTPVLAQDEGEGYDDPFEKFQQVLYMIKNYHVDEFDMETLLRGAIKGMLNEVDSFSSYMTPREYEEMQTELEGRFGGIGIRITSRNDQLTIISPIKGTPGEEVGLQAEDIITHIDGEPTEEMTQEEAVDRMRGEPGTEVELTIYREGEQEPLDFEITRDDIEIPYVESEMLEGNIAHISVLEFGENVGEKVEKEIASLEEEGAEKIILDLRSNPGGLLEEAVSVASNFFDEGRVVSVKQRQGEDEILRVSDDIDSVDMPLVVLINRGSASASEIVAGAIKDRERGILIGDRTFGKGTVQRVIPLEDESAVRLTIARYYTPADNQIKEDEGIEPDIKIEHGLESEEDKQLQKAIEILKEGIYDEELEKAS
ncbi:MAG: S41 family peptidase [Bacillota bacterium]